MVRVPDTAVVRPPECTYSSTTWAFFPPKAVSLSSPLTVTAAAPLPPPKITLTWLPALFTAAAPSIPVCAGGVVPTISPDMSPYHLYRYQAAFGLPPVETRVSPMVPYWFQKARSAQVTPDRSNLAR